MAIAFVQSGDSGTAAIASGTTATVLSSATTPGNTVVLNIVPIPNNTISNPTSLATIATSTGNVSTPTFTPTQNSLIVLTVVSAAVQPNLSITDTWGLSWSNIQKYNSGGQDNAALFWANASSSTPGSITITDSNSAVNAIQPWQIIGQNTIPLGGSIVANATSGNLSSVPQANSLIFTVAVERTGYFTPSWTIPSGYTSLVSNNNPETYTRWSAAYKNGNASQNITWTDSPGTASPVIAGIEILSSTYSSVASITSPIATFNKAVAINGYPQSTEIWYGLATAAGTTITVTTSAGSYNSWAGEFSGIGYPGTINGTANSGTTSGIVFDYTNFDSASAVANFDQNNGTVASLTFNENVQGALAVAGIKATFSITGTTSGWTYYNTGGFTQASGQDVAWSIAPSPTTASAIWNTNSSAYTWDIAGLGLNNWNSIYYFGAMSGAVNRGANW